MPGSGSASQPAKLPSLAGRGLLKEIKILIRKSISGQARLRLSQAPGSRPGSRPGPGPVPGPGPGPQPANLPSLAGTGLLKKIKILIRKSISGHASPDSGSVWLAEVYLRKLMILIRKSRSRHRQTVKVVKTLWFFHFFHFG